MSHIGDPPKALTDVDEVLPSVLDDLKEGLDVLGGIPRDGVMKAAHKGRLCPERREGQLATSDKRQPTGTRHIRPQGGILEGLLALEVGLHVKEKGGELGSPKEG
jgi:hypothetical protein